MVLTADKNVIVFLCPKIMQGYSITRKINFSSENFPVAVKFQVVRS
jgi:hypothetical protein